ncbi:hypothetical protein VULLAG_LOCUS5696 [Vulpes lagopus]
MARPPRSPAAGAWGTDGRGPWRSSSVAVATPQVLGSQISPPLLANPQDWGEGGRECSTAWKLHVPQYFGSPTPPPPGFSVLWHLFSDASFAELILRFTNSQKDS